MSSIQKSRFSIAACAVVLGTFLMFHDVHAASAPATLATTQADDQHIAVQFDGGYDTDPRDRGRPVILVASALGVTADVFRDAFSGVHPAGPNSGGPTPEEARANKRVLLDKLSRYGVDNDRLDEVSNYYRYRRSNGELWKHKSAEAYAVVHDGVVTSIMVTEPGAGYTTPPTVTIPSMPDMKLTASLSFGTDLQTNGSIKSIITEPASKTQNP